VISTPLTREGLNVRWKSLRRLVRAGENKHELEEPETFVIDDVCADRAQGAKASLCVAVAVCLEEC
jgi:hypothetical protein